MGHEKAKDLLKKKSAENLKSVSPNRLRQFFYGLQGKVDFRRNSTTQIVYLTSAEKKIGGT